ncbi:hypothetical protein [Aureimonas sp. SK2]|uniref:hypothetical protein n=1 Tax=Aureimonas sp. SK2 TaxID=3015992 RepID=UPI002443DBD8|nr:hypothetical protein [Aureimonas sp. SK2]
MTKLTLSVLALAAMSSLAGCATTGNPSGCDGWRAIRPSAAEVESASDDLVRQVVEHNRHGAARCGWRA